MSLNVRSGQYQRQQRGHTGCRGCGLPWLHIPPHSPPVVYHDEFHKSLLLQLYHEPSHSDTLKDETPSEPPLVPCLLAAAQELKKKSKRYEECFSDTTNQPVDAIPWSRLQKSAATPLSLTPEQVESTDSGDCVPSGIECATLSEGPQPDLRSFFQSIAEPPPPTSCHDAEELRIPVQTSSQVLHNTAFLGSPGGIAAGRLISKSDPRPECSAACIARALTPTVHDEEATMYQVAYASIRQEMVKNCLAAHAPTLHLEHSRIGRQSVVPSAIRGVLLSHIHLLIAPYGNFSDRDAIVSMTARSLQGAPGAASSMSFPRFEVLILGDEAPTSTCCTSPMTIYFDVAKGISITCSSGNCEQPVLYSAELANDLRVHIWGRWTRFNGGMLPHSYGNQTNYGDLSFSLQPGRLRPEDLTPLSLVPLVDTSDYGSVQSSVFERIILRAEPAVEVNSESAKSSSTPDEIVYSCQDPRFTISSSERSSVPCSRVSSPECNMFAQECKLSRTGSSEKAALLRVGDCSSPEEIHNATANSQQIETGVDFEDVHVRFAAASDEEYPLETEILAEDLCDERETVRATDEADVHDRKTNEVDIPKPFDGVGNITELVRHQLDSKSDHSNHGARFKFRKYNTRERFASIGSYESGQSRLNTEERIMSYDSIDSAMQRGPSPLSPWSIGGDSSFRRSHSPPSIASTGRVKLITPPPTLRDELWVPSCIGENPGKEATSPANRLALSCFKDLLQDVRQKSVTNSATSSITAQDNSPAVVKARSLSQRRESKLAGFADAGNNRGGLGRSKTTCKSPQLEQQVHSSSPGVVTSPLAAKQKCFTRWRLIPPAHADIKRPGVDFSFRSALTFETPHARSQGDSRQPVTAKFSRSVATAQPSQKEGNRRGR